MPTGITSAFCLSTPRLPQIGAVFRAERLKAPAQTGKAEERSPYEAAHGTCGDSSASRGERETVIHSSDTFAMAMYRSVGAGSPPVMAFRNFGKGRHKGAVR